ncbi:FKBP-type peptidyl-prolyl cis-trans isomerase [Sphingobacterium oryzagri]|uniref:Peptidyl-prolyl cis-trans isomerase n=1 Tax=Sphingobacterium oryzagri TaxID=3025669 RepID=A0ABY7WFK7_9SPHI|nr:FKBP-type peptidyl-prolyl cis-trans isomerase [Sphingobacterium sp. KACC 22765]WDF68255.1 FKBP-type peptidyl-prolyl cis-trans isomerase [Sphingobacterium sp. KACC 22765]
MKVFFRFLCAVVVAAVAFSSCSSGNDYDFERALEEQRIKDSLNNVRIRGIIAEQAGAVKTFADQNLTNAKLDTASGIWYQVVQAGDENSYTYEVTPGGISAPTVEVKYKGTLLNGTVFDETAVGKTAQLPLAQLVQAWRYAFWPKTLRFNGVTYQLGGLTPTGLKKGSIIKFVTPSPWAYDTRSSEKIPANSPLYFEIEVVNLR